ncbi:MAG: chlorohydrolase family protein [Actinomycetaceae bacterium]|nr:chlorohydrolase family protein [Actinomycetaceae bacterium]
MKMLKAQFVIAYDTKNKQHTIYRNGHVVYEDDTIVYVGNSYEGRIDSVEDFGCAIISPGFVDLDPIGDFSHALIQSEMSGQQKMRLNWSYDYFSRRRSEYMTPEEEAFKSLYAYIQLIKNGITTAMPITSVLYKKAAETYDECVNAVHNSGRLGLRTYISPSYVCSKAIYGSDGKISLHSIEPEGEEGLEAALKFCHTYKDAYNGLIQPCLTPERVEQMTPCLLEKTRKYADELQCPLRIHGAQSAFEYDYIGEHYKKTPVEYLEHTGFLGPRALLVHGIWTSGYSQLGSRGNQGNSDLKILLKTGTTLIHCPVVQAQAGVALESFGRFKREGISIALATDTFPADMIQNIRAGSMLARHVDNDRSENSFAHFFHAATVDAAQAISRPDLGRLCKGAQADIIVINLSGFHIGPVDDPLRTMALSCTGRDVTHSYIAGRQVMRDRRITAAGIEDELEVLQEKADHYFNKFRNGYLDRADAHDIVDELFRPSFPFAH